MILLFLILLAARFTGNIAKQHQHDVRRSMMDDSAAININDVRHARSGRSSGEEESACSSGHYQRFSYPCSSGDHSSTTCEDVGPAIANGYNNAVYDDCCCESRCTSSNNEINNGVSEDDSTLTWFAHNSYQTALMLNWTASFSGTANPVGYQLWVYMIRYGSSILRCICLPLNTTSYLANVSLTLSFSVQAKLVTISQPTDEQGCAANSVLSITEKIPHYCWDLKGASVEKCGPMFPSAPQNLTVVGRLVNESSLMLLISWEPPAHYAPRIEAYKISVNGKCYCNIGTTLQYITFEFANVSRHIVKVSASSGQVTSYYGTDGPVSQSCCPHASQYNYWSPNLASVTYYPHTTISRTATVDDSVATDTMETNSMAMNTTTTNTMTTKNTILSTSIVQLSTITSLTTNVQSIPTISISDSTVTSTKTTTNSTKAITHKTLTITIAVGATISVISVTLILIIVAVYLNQQKSKKKIYSLVPRIRVSPPQAKSTQVFIVTNSDFEMVRELCHHLSDHNINCTYYKYEENNRKDGPGQLGIVAWTEKCFKESDMVLFVCDHGFSNTWEKKPGPDVQDPYSQIISTSKQLFFGNLQSEDFSKYAVILPSSDYSHIPTLLKNVQSYSITDQESLTRYILQIPKYIPSNHSN